MSDPITDDEIAAWGLLARLRAAEAERDALRKVAEAAERLRARRGYGAGYETNEAIDAVLSALDACPKAGGE